MPKSGPSNVHLHLISSPGHTHAHSRFQLSPLRKSFSDGAPPGGRGALLSVSFRVDVNQSALKTRAATQEEEEENPKKKNKASPEALILKAR